MEQGIKEMLEAYAKALKDGSLLSGETARALAGRMETDMSVRDAVLLMAGCGKNVKWAERFMADPPSFKDEIADMLRKAFKTGLGEERLTYADIALSTMAIAHPTASQPLAVDAYLHWVAGDEHEALHMTDLAFDRDPANSLAALVGSALLKKVKAAELDKN